jgi:hypothetical protein
MRNGLPHHQVLSAVGHPFKLRDGCGPIGMRQIKRDAVLTPALPDSPAWGQRCATADAGCMVARRVGSEAWPLYEGGYGVTTRGPGDSEGGARANRQC